MKAQNETSSVRPSSLYQQSVFSVTTREARPQRVGSCVTESTSSVAQ